MKEKLGCLKIDKKNEKGAISTLVLFTILMMIVILSAIFFGITTKEKSQLKSDVRIQQIYGQDINEVYDELITVESLLPGEKATETIKNNYTDSNGDKATIPAGYTVSNVVEKDNQGNITKDETTIENGLVIKDKRGNEWVWIPVADVTQMYDEDTTGWNLISAEDTTNTKYKSKNLGSSVISRELARTTPDSTSDYREPGILNGASYDANEINLKQAGFNNINQMAKVLADDYKDMIDSIEMYGGFYVGRYELGTNLTTALTNVTTNKGTPQLKKESYVMNYTNWYELYADCKTFSTTDAQARMIWSNQWDEICKFVRDHGNKVNLSNSITYGNYSNSSGNASTNSGTSNFNSSTGRSEYWKTNNIYDLAGNCGEWTQEAHSTNHRSYRGGIYSVNGNDNSITGRYIETPDTSSYNLITSRPTLYIKVSE